MECWIVWPFDPSLDVEDDFGSIGGGPGSLSQSQTVFEVCRAAGLLWNANGVGWGACDGLDLSDGCAASTETK